MIRVVLDTNVLVSAMLFENGPRWWWPRCGRCRACIGLGEDGSTYLASNLLDPVARADAAAASYPSGVVVAERRSTAAATGG